MPRVLSSLPGRLRVGRKLLVMSLLPLAVALFAGSVRVRDRLRILTGAQQELAGLSCIGEVNRVLQAAAAPETPLVSRQATAVLMQVPQCAVAGVSIGSGMSM